MDKERVFRYVRAAHVRLVKLEVAVRTLPLEDGASDIRLAVADAITPLKLIAEEVQLVVEVTHG